MSDDELQATLDALFAWVRAFSPTLSPSAQLAPSDLCDGHHLLQSLSVVSKQHFPSHLVPSQEENKLLRKSIVNDMLGRLSEYCTHFLGAPPSFDASTIVDAEAVASGGDPKAAAAFGELVVAVCVLSGASEIISAIRSMEKPTQKAVQRMTKEAMALRGLKQQKKVAQQQHAGRQSPGAERGSGAATPQTGMDDGDGAAASGGSGGADDTGAGGGGGAGADGMEGGGASGSGGGGSGYADHRQWLEEKRELECRLDDAVAAKDTLDSKLQLVEAQLETAEAKYRNLLEEAQSRGPAGRERELQQQVAKKDGQVRALEEELAAANTALRERTKTQEEAEERLSEKERECGELQRQHKAASDEKGKAQARLEVAQDQLQIACRRRDELESLVSTLEAEGQAMTAKLERLEGDGDGDADSNSGNRNNRGKNKNKSNRKGGDAGARVAELEAELEALTARNDGLQSELRFFQSHASKKGSGAQQTAAAGGGSGDDDQQTIALEAYNLMRDEADRHRLHAEALEADTTKLSGELDRAREQLSAVESTLSDALERNRVFEDEQLATPNNSAAVAEMEARITQLELGLAKEQQSLGRAQEHTRMAVAEAENLREQLSQQQQADASGAPRTQQQQQQQQQQQPSLSQSQSASAHSAGADLTIKQRILEARRLQRREQTMVLNQFYEMGQRAMQVQQRHHLGCMTRNRLSSEYLTHKSGGEVHFVERYRRLIEREMMNLAPSSSSVSMNSPPPRHSGTH